MIQIEQIWKFIEFGVLGVISKYLKKQLGTSRMDKISTHQLQTVSLHTVERCIIYDGILSYPRFSERI